MTLSGIAAQIEELKVMMGQMASRLSFLEREFQKMSPKMDLDGADGSRAAASAAEEPAAGALSPGRAEDGEAGRCVKGAQIKNPELKKMTPKKNLGDGAQCSTSSAAAAKVPAAGALSPSSAEDGVPDARKTASHRQWHDAQPLKPVVRTERDHGESVFATTYHLSARRARPGTGNDVGKDWRFHLVSTCHGLKAATKVESVSFAEAMTLSLTPCRICAMIEA